MLRLTLHTAASVPLELDGITPTAVANLSALEVAKRPVAHGNRAEPLGTFFRVEGDASDGELLLHGDLSQVHNIAANLAAGKIVVEGNVGLHAGAGMTGGELVVLGDAGDWLGAEMAGGSIRVYGGAGHNAGGAYVGSRRGMTGGTIVIADDAGDELGALMRRGLIAVGGRCGAFAGAGMIAGTVVAAGGFGPRAGAGLKRGTLVSAGPCGELPPGWRYSCRYRPAYLGLLAARLQELAFALRLDGEANCYRGDVLTGGNGERLELV